MITYIGNYCIVIAILMGFINIFLFRKKLINVSQINEKFFLLNTRLSFIFILLSFICLIIAYITSDFKNLNVFYNSHTAKPLVYKIAGVWGNHEGSLLLWIFVLSFYTFIFSYEKQIDKNVKYWTIFFQSIITVTLVIFLETINYRC